MTSLHRSRTVAAAAALAVAGLVLAPPAQAATGSVKGVVSLEGKPVKGLTVQLQQSTDDGDVYTPIKKGTTDGKGGYSFSGFPVGDVYGYNVLVSDPTFTVVKARRSFKDTTKPVTRNVTVKRAASLRGKVVRADGGSPSTLRVHLDGPDDEIGTPDTTVLSYPDVVKPAEDGTYSAKGLPAGTYAVSFTDTSKTYSGQCYDNVVPTDPDETCDAEQEPAATLTTLDGGDATTLHSQLMAHDANHIAGRVTDTSGNPISDVRVEAVPDGEEYGFEQGFSQPGTGNFKVAWFADGRYRLLVDPSSSTWASQWFDGRTSADGATLFDVAGEDVDGVQVRLKSAAIIEAGLTPGPGTVTVAVTVTRAATGSKPSGTVTIRWGGISKTVSLVKGKGTAKLSGLPKGKRQITVSYSGTTSTATTTQLFYSEVK